MEKIEFKINHNKGFIRWENWKNFIKKINIFGNQNYNNKNAVLFVTYNNSVETIKLLEIFRKELRKDFDIIIIDNNSNEKEFEKLKIYLNNYSDNKIILIQAIDNLGGGGGYALGLEYIFSKPYEYVIITEDDAIPLQNNTITEILNQNNNGKDEIVIKYKELNTTSFTLHFHGYPINLLKLSGVLDPRYFMRSDDLEYAYRIEYTKRKLKTNIKILNKLLYTHPVIKPKGNKFWQIYFGQRNSNFTISRWNINIFHFIIMLLYIITGYAKIFKNKNFYYLKVVILAYLDFIFIKFGYNFNKQRLSYLFKLKDSTYNDNSFKTIKIENLNKKIKNFYFSANSCNYLKNKLIFSKKILNFFKNGCIISGFNSPLYFLYIISPINLSIEEDLGNGILKIYEIKNNNLVKNYLIIFISIFLGLITFITIVPIIIFRIIIGKIFKI